MTNSKQSQSNETNKQDPLRYGGPVQLVTTPIVWWSGLGFLLVFGVLVWAILGRIPVISNGKGAFSYPFRVQAINLPTSDTDAKVKKIYKVAGSVVRKNEILATLDVPKSEYTVEASREKLKLAESKLKSAEDQNLPLIRLAEDQSNAFKTQIDAYKKLLEEGYKLKKKGVISETTYISTKNSYNQSKNSYVEKQDNIQNYKNNIVTARQALREAQIQLNQDLETLDDYTVVKSAFNGFVLDVQYAEASPVSSKPLMNILDMSGFKVENIPSNLKTILRQIESLEDNIEKNNIKSGSNSSINNEVVIPLYVLAYFSQDSGKQISVGMEARILPDNVKANTVGTLRGQVISVYPLPATSDSASSILGSPSLAKDLVKDGSARQVLIKLFPNKNYPSGYQWISGRGPSLPSQVPTIGGLASVNIIVEKKPPIILALPALRKAFGLPQGTN